MRLLVLIILTAAFGWSTFWFTGKTIRETELKNWFTERNEAGWIVENTLSLRGFPNRFDAIIKDIKLKNPRTGWAWSTDRLEILQLSYQPNHFIVLWPKNQQIDTPSQKLLVNSDELRGSVIFKPNSEHLLKRATISAESLTLSSNKNWDITFKSLVLALRKSGKGDNLYDFGLDTKGFYLPQSFMNKIDSEESMPKYFKSLHLDTNIQFSKVLNQKSFKKGTTILQNLKINDAHFEWGTLNVRAAGGVRLDMDGYPTGKLTIRIKNWEKALDLLIENNSLDQSIKSTVRSAFKIFSALSGSKQELDIPLQFSDRKIFLGFIPIGDAPRIKLP